MRLPLWVGRNIFRSFGVWESVVLSILRPESRRTRLNTQLQWLKQIKRPKLTGASCWRSGRPLDHDAPVRQLAWVWIFWSNSNVNLNLLHWNYFFILFLDVYSFLLFRFFFFISSCLFSASSLQPAVASYLRLLILRRDLWPCFLFWTCRCGGPFCWGFGRRFWRVSQVCPDQEFSESDELTWWESLSQMFFFSVTQTRK